VKILPGTLLRKKLVPAFQYSTCDSKSCSESRCDPENCYESRPQMYTGENRANEREGKPELKFYAAFEAILRICKYF
jgi:hypothetical protein